MEELKRAGVRVPGIGHRIKSKDNRDKRVELLQEYARAHFPTCAHLDYAVQARGGLARVLGRVLGFWSGL